MQVLQKIKSSWELCKELGPLGPLLIFVVAMPGLGALVLISSSEQWYSGMRELGDWAIPTFIFLTITLAGLSLIPTHAVSLIGGMLFGLVEGPVYAMISVVATACFAFQLMGLILKESTVAVLLKRPRAAEVHAELLTKSGLKAVLFISLIRLSPIMPFAATNLLLAASKVKTSYFILGSMIGLAPRVVLVAVAGAGLAQLDFSKSSNQWLAWVGGISTLVLIFLIGKVFKKVYSKSIGPGGGVS